MKVYINGRLVDKKDAKISVFDHGLLYGDGVFEGIRSYDGLVFKLKEHIDRLFTSARRIMLKIPLSKQQLTGAIIKTLKANKLKNAYIRVVVSRGEGDLGLDPRKCKKANIIIIADRIALYPEKFYREGLEIVIASTRRNAPEALDPRIKSLNYLNNILAKIEGVRSGCPEALMLNAGGFVAECTGDNIFIVKNKRLFTPPTDCGTLEGITRNAVIKIARRRLISFREKVLTPEELYRADECFLTGTAAEIVPVTKIDSRNIGNGKPGKTTLFLMQHFRKLTTNNGLRYA